MKKLLVFLLFAGVISFIPSSLHPLFSSSLIAQIPADGLVAWYPFNGNANDESGNNHHGSITGGTFVNGRNGNASGAIQFTSSATGFVDANIGSNYTQNFTVSMWVKADRTSTFVNESSTCPGGVSVPMANSNQNWALIPPNYGSNLGAGIAVNQNGIIVAEHANNVLVSRLSRSISSTAFNHVVIVYRTDSTFLYLNGSLVRSRVMYCPSNSKNTGSNLRFGGSLYSPNFAGSIDDVGIWSRALTRQEVQLIYSDQTGQVQQPFTCNITAPVTTICAGESVTLSVNTTGGSGSSSQLPANLQQGLVAYYPFNGNANDESGNGNDGTVNGANLTQDRFGNSGNAYSLDGISNVITVPVNSTLLPANVSISMWIKVNQYNPNNADLQRIIRSRFFGYMFDFVHSSQQLVFRVHNNSNGNVNVANSYVLSNPYSDWHFVTGTFDGTVNKLYVDGILVNQVNAATSGSIYYASDGQLAIGRDGNSTVSGTSHYAGQLDDIAIYNRALSPSEIQQLYTSQSFAWNTGSTTSSITVTPAANTTYSCTVTQVAQTCTASVDITVNPTFTNEMSATIIEGETYNLGTQTLTAAGTYTEVFTSAAGCDSTVTLTLAVEPLLTCSITAPVTTICAGESVTLSVNTTGVSGSTSQLPANLQNGLLAAYTFDANTNDGSGNGKHLVNLGAQLTTDRFGNQNSAYLFSNSRMYNSDGSYFMSQLFSYSYWVNCQGSIGGHTISKSSWENASGEAWNSAIANGNTCGFGTKGNSNCVPGSGWSTQSFFSVLGLNQGWHMMSCTFNGNIQSMFLDGQLMLVRTLSSAMDQCSGGQFKVGAWWQSQPNYFSGKIDDIFIYNRALSTSEIQQLYTSQSFAWNTGAATSSITVTPTADTTYSCTVTQGNSTCTASVDITVNPVVTNAISASIVEGQSYTLGTQTLTTAGTYTEVFTSAAGCDSTVTLTLAVEPLLTCDISSVNTTICQGSATVLTTNAPPSALQIGSVGPGGGLIFYDKGIESNGWRYLEAAPGDIDLSSWGCPDNFISGASQSGIGFGLSNSLAIAQQCSDPNSAASRCLNYSVNGKDNWHLPSKEEFNVMYQNLISQGLGNFATEAIPTYGLLYWTSTQFDSGSGWHYYGVEPWLFAAFSKLYAIYVRPVRYVSQSEVISSSVLWSNGATTPTTTVSPTSNTIYYCTVTTNTQTCTDSIAITVNPALTWYADADGDGFGNPNAVVLDCNQPAGYVLDNTDCNDAVASAYPGAEEICDNGIDEDCNGQDSICFVAVLGCTNPNACNFNPAANTDDNSCVLPQPEVCDGLDNNCNNQVDEGFTIPTINPVAVTPALYPVCTGNALKSADFNNGINSPIIDGNGPDLWYSFTAQFNTLRVGLSAAFGDNSIGLYTLNNGCLELITEEHEVYTATTAATGNQILLSDQLTVGQTYYVAVHQIAGPTNASAKVCFTYLNGSGCDHYYSNNTGLYTSVCNSFKAQYRANATNYIFNVLSGTQNGVNMNLTPWSYTNNNANSVVARLGSILPANHSGANRVYTLAVPVVYGLTDAAGNVSSLLANATTTCTVTLNSEATIALRQADRCPAAKSITATIAPDRTVCGAMRYDWEFTEVLPNPGTAQVVQGGAYASVFFLSNVPGVATGKTYNVRVRPVHSSGVAGNWGSVQCLRIGNAGMVLDIHPVSAGAEPPLLSLRAGGEMNASYSIYPNPTATGSFVLQYNGSRRGESIFAQETTMESTVPQEPTTTESTIAQETTMESTQELKMMDITGKVVYQQQVVLNGNAVEIQFGKLASGVYVVMVGEERMRLIIE